jgi:V/A-type H+-transporting ATPase subunit E
MQKVLSDPTEHPNITPLIGRLEMGEELQDLLDRIQKDGVGKAEERAAEIVSAAETKAKNILKKAQADADASHEKAQQDAATLISRSEKALEQSARDVILSVGSAVTSILEQIVASQVTDALTPDVLKKLLATAVGSYFSSKEQGENLQVSLNPDDEAALRDFFMSELKTAAGHGLEIHGDNGVIKGFKLSLVNGAAHHDFTREAIAESLCQLLRPHLADIVRHAASEGK